MLNRFNEDIGPTLLAFETELQSEMQRLGTLLESSSSPRGSTGKSNYASNDTGDANRDNAYNDDGSTTNEHSNVVVRDKLEQLSAKLNEALCASIENIIFMPASLKRSSNGAEKSPSANTATTNPNKSIHHCSNDDDDDREPYFEQQKQQQILLRSVITSSEGKRVVAFVQALRSLITLPLQELQTAITARHNLYHHLQEDCDDVGGKRRTKSSCVGGCCFCDKESYCSEWRKTFPILSKPPGHNSVSWLGEIGHKPFIDSENKKDSYGITGSGTNIANSHSRTWKNYCMSCLVGFTRYIHSEIANTTLKFVLALAIGAGFSFFPPFSAFFEFTRAYPLWPA